LFTTTLKLSVVGVGTFVSADFLQEREVRIRIKDKDAVNNCRFIDLICGERLYLLQGV
jgi:hypothetical protein